jgi:hypothetical protein
MPIFSAGISKNERSRFGTFMAEDLEILAALRRHGVPFVIIGGHAVNFHGFIRATEDLDVVWLRTRESELNLLVALQEIEAQYITNQIDPKTGIERTAPVELTFIQSSPLMMLFTRFGFLDLFDYAPGMSEIDVKELLQSSLESEGLRYASLSWMRQMKKSSARPKDLLDLENLPE